MSEKFMRIVLPLLSPPLSEYPQGRALVSISSIVQFLSWRKLGSKILREIFRR